MGLPKLSAGESPSLLCSPLDAAAKRARLGPCLQARTPPRRAPRARRATRGRPPIRFRHIISGSLRRVLVCLGSHRHPQPCTSGGLDQTAFPSCFHSATMLSTRLFTMSIGKPLWKALSASMTCSFGQPFEVQYRFNVPYFMGAFEKYFVTYAAADFASFTLNTCCIGEFNNSMPCWDSHCRSTQWPAHKMCMCGQPLKCCSNTAKYSHLCQGLSRLHLCTMVRHAFTIAFAVSSSFAYWPRLHVNVMKRFGLPSIPRAIRQRAFHSAHSGQLHRLHLTGAVT